MEGKYKLKKQEEDVKALQDTIYVIGGKWKLPILNSMCDGNKRFREIERSIPKITTRMLSKELKELEINGFITRKVIDNTPVQVIYEFNEYAKTLVPVLKAMIKWGKEHAKMVRGVSKIKSSSRQKTC